VSDLLPATDGLFLGETLTPRRWDGSKLRFSQIDVGPSDPSKVYVGSYLLKSETAPAVLGLRNRADNAHAMFRCGGFYSMGNCEIWGYVLAKTEIWGDGNPTSIKQRNTGGAFDEVARLVKAGTACLEVPRAGDITFLDDKFLKLGKDSDGNLPTPDSSYRGKMIRVEGGVGEADKLYVCMKSSSEAHSWVQIGSG